MALVQMENELQCSSAVSQLSGKSVDAAGNIATYTAEGADSGRVSAPLVVEPARREVMTTAEKDERSERTRARQAACAAAAQRLADGAELVEHVPLARHRGELGAQGVEQVVGEGVGVEGAERIRMALHGQKCMRKKFAKLMRARMLRVWCKIAL